MGGQSVKRRKLKVTRRKAKQGLEVWAWKSGWCSLCCVSLGKPTKERDGTWWAPGRTLLCRDVFGQLAGVKLDRDVAMPPTRVRIPVWTVLKK